MNYINVYLYILKNKINYDLFYFNKIKKIYFIFTLNYLLIENNNNCIKWHKFFCKQNGFKIILLQNWYKFGIKQNLIKNIFKK